MLRSKKMYDMCFRSLQGLPLPARSLTCLLIESILARLIRTEDIIVCSYVWMSNHTHTQLFSLDISALTAFHEGLKKRLTDHLKRLLGLARLRLWDDRTTLAEVLDVDSAIERVAYSYLNPVRAGLVRSIDEYQGCNTWKEFLSAPAHINAVIEKEVPWILSTDIEPLNRSNPSLAEERRVVESLRLAAKQRSHTLRIYPFKWLEAFNITAPNEIEGVRTRVIQLVREQEHQLAAKKSPLQRIEGFDVSGAYVPLKKERKVFMYGSTKEIRQSFLLLFDSIISRCRMCYDLTKKGVLYIPWPPECFIPPAPRLANAFG